MLAMCSRRSTIDPKGAEGSSGCSRSALPPNVEPGGPVDADLDTLATALYVEVDELRKAARSWRGGGQR
jgi:hypothetical protein